MKKTQPKRGRCPKCGKAGLGQVKTHADARPNQFYRPILAYPFRQCRYCGHCETVPRNDN